MNNLVKNSGLAVIALATLNLSGCKHHPAGANAATGLSDGTGAQAYALAEGKGYQGQLKKDSEGRIINHWLPRLIRLIILISTALNCALWI
ncbi:hypothetical protein [Coxiella burnetii]|uniref:hypothetical protein n=1 Tax=Coxiella burnetii TaxID=777 RepID=UPI0003FA5EE1|nr:hypothetical protein [Coxiella burnetii]